MTESGLPSTDRPGVVLQGLLDLRPTPSAERMALPADDAVAQGLAFLRRSLTVLSVSEPIHSRFSPYSA